MQLRLSKNLAPLKAAALADIDAQAEATRGLFLTPGSAQAMVYDQKRIEADLYMTDAQTPAHLIPHLLAEAAMNDITPFEQAVEYLTMQQLWLTISPVIETQRLAAKRAVEAATNPAGIEAARNIDWGGILAYAP